MAKKSLAPHRPAPSSFSEIAGLAAWLEQHAFAIWMRAGEIKYLQQDDNPDVEKVEVARAIFGKIIARRLVLLVGVATRLNALLEDKPPLSPKDEAWLRRQLEGLPSGGVMTTRANLQAVDRATKYHPRQRRNFQGPGGRVVARGAAAWGSRV